MSVTKSVLIKTTAQWRAWLEKNHEKERKVNLISYKKHTGKPSISHREAMEEAICFGWIDTTIKRLDDERFQRCFVKRNKNSRWSKATQRYAKELIKAKRMTPFGLQMYKEGLKKPVIDHGLPKNPDTPKDLTKALAKDKIARENFAKLAPSYRRMFIYWIEQAKRPETREKRIQQTVLKMNENKKTIL